MRLHVSGHINRDIIIKKIFIYLFYRRFDTDIDGCRDNLLYLGTIFGQKRKSFRT